MDKIKIYRREAWSDMHSQEHLWSDIHSQEYLLLTQRVCASS